jgi:transcriptional regulator with XRE-family HTH domain
MDRGRDLDQDGRLVLRSGQNVYTGWRSEEVRAMAEETTLAASLRQLRLDRGLGLREAATKAGITHGYLSQIESDKIREPAPQTLQKLAEAYDEPFVLLMQWAGYLEQDEVGLSANQQRALKIVGEPTDQELVAIRAVLDAIRAGGATFAFEQLDGELSSKELRVIRGHAVALLQRADALGEIPTPLDRVTEVSKLVLAGEIELEPEMKRKLRERFGELVDRALNMILGSIRFDTRSVYLQPDMYRLRKRFVHAHEIGHEMLPWHRELYAFLDDKTRIRSDVNDRYERQANQSAIEILAQGDVLRKEADDSPITFGLVDYLGSRYEISTQATVRRLVEESRQDVALAVSYRGAATGKLMPAHLYCSPTFEKRFRWQFTARMTETIQKLVLAASRRESLEPMLDRDVRNGLMTLEVDSLERGPAVLLLFRPIPSRTKVRSRTALKR